MIALIVSRNKLFNSSAHSSTAFHTVLSHISFYSAVINTCSNVPLILNTRCQNTGAILNYISFSRNGSVALF